MKSGPTAAALLREAKDDAPTKETREAMWKSIESVTMGVGIIGTAAYGTKILGTKMLALFGVAATVGIATAVVVTRVPPPIEVSDEIVVKHEVSINSVSAPTLISNQPARAEPNVPKTQQVIVVQKPLDPVAPSPDVFARESQIVREARLALVQGSPQHALDVLAGVKALSSRVLEPEELAIEARALRDLGRTSEAEAIETQLRTKYPGQGLTQ